MKVKKYSECSVELNNIDNIVVIEPNNDEEHIKATAINHFLSLDSCNNDFKELLKNNLAKIDVKRLYVPVYSIKCMVNDDYRVSYLENGNAIVHVVCGDNEARVDEENLENVHKEEVVRFEGDYHFCCSEYKGPFSNKFIHLDLNTYLEKSNDFDNLDLIDKFISQKTLNKLINEKVTQAFLEQGLTQAKKYILGKHQDAEYLDCKQNTKIIDCQKTIYLVPMYEIVVNFSDEEYISYISGVDNIVEYEFPRSKDYITYNAKTRRNYFIRTILINLMFILIGGVGIVTAMFLKDNLAGFTNTHFIVSTIGISIICIVALVTYLLVHKRFKKQKELVLSKYEKMSKKPKSLYFVSLLMVGIIDLLCIAGIIVLLLI